MKPVLTLAIAAAISAASLAAHAQDTVTIGFPVALSGFIAPYDDGPRKAALLAIDEINAKGGLLGKKIVTADADTKSDPGLGANAATEVLAAGAKVVMVTCDFDFGAPAALVAQSKNVLAFSSCAADPKFGVQGIGPDAYTMSTATPSQGATLADWAFTKKGFKTVYVLLDTQVEYTKSLCREFEQRYTELAGASAIIGRDTYNAASDTSITAQVSHLKAASPAPDFIMFCGAINGGSYVRQICAGGINTPLVASESMDGAYWLSAVPNLSDFYVAVYGSVFSNDPDARVNEFVKRFVAKFGAPPVTGHALTGYSFVQAWALAVQRAKSFDTDAVRAELDKFKAEDFLVGATSFSPELHINVDRPMLIMKITDGKHEPVGRYVSSVIPQIKF